ncbi:DUF5362 family protein [Gilliamella apicola]|uniref:Uncharacterized protein n=1 Tax=Gilliamella apicola TaxID=1196095 RepID=A0A2V4DUP5_9GAMM|nr:DUF5362 family protein [Gilliamella apicola]PXZ04392.1 hypothetical protein DKK79_08525 [Gilliamella apicola]
MFNNQTTIISTISNEQSNELLKDKMKFIAIMQQIFGVLNIIGGSFFCLGILTAIIGIPLIIAGVKLFKSGGHLVWPQVLIEKRTISKLSIIYMGIGSLH